MSESISAIIISVNPDKTRSVMAKISNTVSEIVVVADDKTKFNHPDYREPSVKLISSRSKNFSFLRNIGIYYASGRFVFMIDDDESLSDELLYSLGQIKGENDAYLVRRNAAFGGKVLNMWSRVVPRVVKKEKAHYIGKVHEYLPLKYTSQGSLVGTITNNSYENWSDYWKKAFKTTSLETKKLGTFLFRLLFPLYNYFDKEGYKDGKLGLEVVATSIIYSFLMLWRGMRFRKIDLNSFLENSKAFSISSLGKDEQSYFSYMISELERGFIPPGSSIHEECEQLSSVMQQ